MYHEEKIIDGVLCWRGTPDGEWTQYTLQALTSALRAERVRSKDMEEAASKACGQLSAIRIALGITK